MEVTRRLIIVAVLASLQFVSTSGDIIVQPGYEKKSSNPVKSESPVANEPRQSTLAEEIQRYNNIQRTLQSQILQLVNQRHQIQHLQAMPHEVVGYPFSPIVGSHLHPISHPYYSSANLHSLTPTGLRGLNIKGYGIRKPSHLLREGPSEETNADESDVGKSAEDESELDGGLDQVHDVAAEPSVEESEINEVIELPVSENNADENRTKEKLVETRQIGQPDDIIVGSPLDRIYYNQYDNQDQHHPINSERMTSRVTNTDQTVGGIIDTKAPRVTDFQNDKGKDSIPSMRRHKDSDTREKGQSIEAKNNWRVDKMRNNDEGITGKSWSEEQRKKYPQSLKAASNDRQSQQRAASNPAMNNAMKNKVRMITPRTFHSTNFQHHSHQPGDQPGYQSAFQPNFQPNFQPGYQPYFQPNYQPYYQNNYGSPPIGNNQPLHGNSGSTSTSYASAGPSGSTASASSSKSNDNNSYKSSYFSSPYVALVPYSSPKFVDQFGRTILSAVPSNWNFMITNSNPKSLYGVQLVSVSQQPRYWY